MTDQSNAEFERIVLSLMATEDNVSLGKMMSLPGLKCGDKVFAFRAKTGMGFRLGRDFDPDACDDIEFEPLNPFKTKGPLKGWFVVGDEQNEAWEDLARSALAFTRTL